MTTHDPQSDAGDSSRTDLLPDPDTCAWVVAQVGDVRWGERLDTPFGEARVQRAAAIDDSDRWILKQHRAAAGHRAETAALLTLGPQLRPHIPALVAYRDAPRALLLRQSPGTPVDQLREPTALAAAYEAAGGFLTQLQSVPLLSRDPMSIEEAIARRLAGWLDRSPLSNQLRGLANALVDPTCFTGTDRVWAHRDFQPANWLWDGTSLTVLDFGHARPDSAVADLVKLAAGPWRRDLSLKEAFQRGYRGPYDRRREAQLSSLCALHGLATASWGARHGDEAARREGEAVLRWCADRT